MKWFADMVYRFDTRVMNRDEFREFVSECECRTRVCILVPTLTRTRAAEYDRAVCNSILDVFKPVEKDITIQMRDSRKLRARTQTFEVNT